MRKPRRIQQGAVYHVVARTNRGEFILDSDRMKNLFISILMEGKKKYPFKLKHFCIMSNHVHLLIEPRPETSLSQLMQWVLSVFARRFNIITKQYGHVWYDRFKSKIIQNFRQFLKTFNYISMNPVKAGMCRDIGEYPFSGIKFLREKVHDLLDPSDDYLYLVIPDLSFPRK